MTLVGLRLWNGEPYPSADPDWAAARLKEEMQRVNDEASFPRTTEAPTRVERHSCDYRGFNSIAHIDQGRRDVRGLRLSWRVMDVPEAAARAAQERTRLRLAGGGWKLTGENISDRRFRFENADTGDKADVGWYRSTGTVAVTLYAPCGQVPEAFDEYDWPGARWAPA